MSPDHELPDDRLIERLGSALRAPHVEPTGTEIERLHRAIAKGQPEPAGVVPLAPESPRRLIRLSPRIDAARKAAELHGDGAEDLAIALDMLAAVMLGGDREAISNASAELRSRLDALGVLPRRDVMRRARRLLSDAARLLLSTPPADPGRATT